MKVLIIDDSPTEVHVVKQYLLEHDMEVSVAHSADKGIAMAKELLPDAILMDVVMPGVNGFQATRQLSRDNLTGHIPIVILTTKGAETDRLWGMRQGAIDYLVKPVDGDELVKLLKRLTTN